MGGSVITAAFLCGFFYLNYFIFLPKYYFQGKRNQYGIALIISALLIVFSIASFDIFVPEFFLERSHGKFIFGLSVFMRFVIVLSISIGIRSYQQWKLAESQRLSAELDFLKAQINPHFLFNSLNSIYSLILAKNDDAAKSVVKLSNIMRYVTSEASHEWVALEKELEYIRNYIDLQRIRLTELTKVNFEVVGDTAGVKVAPLLFIPFIENAFKFGVSTKVESSIFIRFLVDDEALIFETENSLHKREGSESGTGLGISNTMKRLHLTYPEKFEINNSETTENTYKVRLKIKLK